MKKVVCEMVSYYSSLRGGTCSCFLRCCTYARLGFVLPSRASFIDRNLIRVLPHLQYTNYPFHCSIYSVYQTSFILLVRFEWYLNWWRLKQCNSEYDCKAQSICGTATFCTSSSFSTVTYVLDSIRDRSQAHQLHANGE